MKTALPKAWPVKTRELHNHHMDSTVWNDFKFRGDDIVIATYGKSGTTWMQQIVSQLIFNGEEGINVGALSPWVDLRIMPKEALLGLEAQTHRRFMKTHLPADAMVIKPEVKYIYIAPISLPLFTAGAIAGQVPSAEAVQQQALFGYQKAIQEAFREVNDELVSQDRTGAQLKAQKEQVQSLTQYSQIARLRYDNGYTSYIEVLDAERSLFNAQLQYTQTQQAQFQAMTNLYKAMGGGWVAEAEKMSTPPAEK